MNQIQKLDSSLQWQTTHNVKDTYAGPKKLQQMGARYGWKFIKDTSIYGGYYVDQTGDCYRLA